MKFSLSKYCILLFANVFSVSLAQQNSILIAADNWCPFTCENNQLPGIVVEIGAKGVASKNWLHKFQILPWVKAVRDSQRGTVAALAGASRPDGTHLVFPLEEQGLQKSCIYAPANSPLLGKISKTATIDEKLKALKGMKFGIAGGYSYGMPLDGILSSASKKTDSGIEFVESNAQNPTEELYKWLESGKIQAFVESDAVLNYTINLNHWNTKFTNVFCLEPIQVFLAFSNKFPQATEMAYAVTEETKKLRASGELKKILSKYGLVDWK
jgi:polar amino acid transport system substrate-binding protein